MHPLEVKECLESMYVIGDTREQLTARYKHRIAQFERYQISKLNYGDYTYGFVLNGHDIYEHSDTISAPVVIERKMSLVEFSGNLCERQQEKHKADNLRNRFEAEFHRARQNNAKVYLLIEDGSIDSIIQHKYKTRLNPNSMLGSLLAYTARYDIVPIFCSQMVSGRIIREILYRELKQRLERGDYD